jgi:hypothetical protein
VPLQDTVVFGDIEEGTQCGFVVDDATYNPEERFGAEIAFELGVVKPAEHQGTTILSSLGLSQPRLNKVRNLRADKISDQEIARSLREKGFEFTEIDEDEPPRLGGTIKKIVKAALGEDPAAYKKLINSLNDFHELAAWLVGKEFIGTTRKDAKGYSRLDGKAEIYRVVETKPAENLGGHDGDITAEDEEDFDNIPF